MNLPTQLLSLFFRLLYHSFAWAYNLVAWVVSLGHWQDWVQTVIPLLGEGAVLELGHGPGHLQRALAQAGRRVFGLDESRQMGQMARRRLAGQWTPRLARAVAQSIPFASGSFTTVVATFPSEYIFDPRTIGEMRRVLRPGGKGVILLAVWITGNSLPQRLIRLVYRATGETPKNLELLDRVAGRFQAEGFAYSTRWIDTDGARLFLIEVQSPSSSPEN